MLGLAALLAGYARAARLADGAGALYLLWLGFSTLRSWRGASFGTGAAADAGGRPPANQFRIFLQGMGTSGINPKGLLFFVALVPQFVSPEAASAGSGPVRAAGPDVRPARGGHLQLRGAAGPETAAVPAGPARRVTLASGVIMLALGAVLLAEQLIPRGRRRRHSALSGTASKGGKAHEGYLRCMYHSVKDDARPSAVSWMTQRLS